MPEGIGRLSKFFNLVGGSMSLLLRLCYISLIIYCLFSIEGLLNNQPAWYRNEVAFSDWRNVKKVDFSTNAVVANWYSGGNSQYLRQAQMKDVMAKLNRGDTITIGLDYYALRPISSPFFEKNFLMANYLRLDNGEVITIRMWKKNNLFYSTEYRN